MFDLYVQELSDLVRSFPGFKPVPKKGSWLCKIAGALLWLLTWGRSNFSKYHTVLGKTLYTGEDWDQLSWVQKLIILRHKRKHLEQARDCGFGLFWLGWFLWSFSYLFLLPAGITLRAYWEREAYAETIKASRRFGIAIDREWVVQQFVSCQYLFMDPRRAKMESWFDRQLLLP